MANPAQSAVLRVLCVTAFLTLAAVPTRANDNQPLMRNPDVHGETVVFVARGDLWIWDGTAAPARQLTTSPGNELYPRFSPNGEWVAFTGQASGEPQVYVIPSVGGEPKRLTFYPAQWTTDHQVIDWTPDGRNVVYRSLRGDGPQGITRRTGRLYSIPATGGWPSALPLSEGSAAAFSPNGRKIAYTTSGIYTAPWKRYRGGLSTDIWLFDFDTKEDRRLTRDPAVDQHPTWHEDEVYFVSDRTGTLNLFAYDLRKRKTRQITHSTTWDVKWPGSDSKRIVYEMAGSIQAYEFASGATLGLPIRLPPIDAALPSEIDVGANIEQVSAADDGKLVIAARGDLFVVNAGLATSRNLTESPGVREREPTWNSDGDTIAFISDESGIEELWTIDVDGGKRRLTQDSKSMLRHPIWSPDGKLIAFSDYSGKLWLVDLSSGVRRQIASSETTYPDHYHWSPDSSLLIYARLEKDGVARVHSYDVASGMNALVADPRHGCGPSAFDAVGAKLYCFGPANAMLAIGRWELEAAYPEVDAAYAIEFGFAGSKTNPARLIEGLKPGKFGDISASGETLFFSRATLGEAESGYHGSGRPLWASDLKAKTETKLADSVAAFSLSPKGARLAWWNNEGVVTIATGDGAKPVRRPVSALALKAPMEDALSRRQMFREAWRWQRENRYLPSGRAVDWQKMLDKYLPLVDRAANGHDLNYLIAEMLGEQEVGHLAIYGEDGAFSKPSKVGLLGAEFEPDADGFFKVSRILRPASGDQVLAPLADAEVKIKEGDYILSINGKPLRAPDNPFRLLEGALGRPIDILVNDRPEERGARTLRTDAIESEIELRYNEWTERAYAFVTEASNGRVGYVHIPNTDDDGFTRFLRSWFPQTGREAMIVDVRYNAGGYLAEAVVERLLRKPIGAVRCSACGPTGDLARWSHATYPAGAYSGVIVLLTNGHSASDGDNIAYFFKQSKRGPIVGGRTWGGVIGSVSRTLMDGRVVTAANNVVARLDLRAEIENVGVEPDIEVVNLPSEEALGRDEQLETAIRVALEKLGRAKSD